MSASGLFRTSIVIAAVWTAACSVRADTVTAPSPVGPSTPIGSVAPPTGDRGPAPNPQPSPPASRTCDAAKAQWALGEPASSDLSERARVAARAEAARFIRPDQPITTEFLPWRLNLGLDKQDIVVAVSCG
jgi:Peptidase inhibitor I78 family